MQPITTLIILTSLFQPCHQLSLYRPPVNYVHVAGTLKQIVAVPENLDNLFALRLNQGRLDTLQMRADSLTKLNDLANNMLCGPQKMVAAISDGKAMNGKCIEPPDASGPSPNHDFRVQFPLELPAATSVRRYFNQSGSELLPEMLSQDLAFLRRRARRFVDLEDEEVDMSPQELPYRKPDTPMADPAVLAQFKQVMSSIQHSEESLAAQSKSTLLGRAETTASLPTRTGTLLPTPIVSAQWAYIYHKNYPALFSTPTPTPTAKVPVQTPLFYVTTTVTTWTMDVLYPGDPVPTLTSYILSPVYLNDVLPTTTSTSTRSTSSTNVAVPARARGRGVVVMAVVITIVVMV